MMSVLADIGACMFLCFATFGGYRFLLHARGINYIDRMWITTLYFFAAGLLTAVLFSGYISLLFSGSAAIPLALLALFTSAQILAYVLIPRYMPEQTSYFDTHPDRDYLRIHWKRLIAKSADIAAQQVFIAVLVLSLDASGLSLAAVILAFAVLFFILHIPLLASEWRQWPALAFGGAVAVFSILFPILILTVDYGVVYTFIIHWLFYDAIAIGFAVARRAAATEAGT